MKPPAFIRAAWLSADATQAVFEAIERGGFEARAVGGIVRNTLLGLPATDIDIATTAPPEATMRLAIAAGLTAIPTGLAHGTVTVVSGGVPYEVTTLRRDVEPDGRHAQVVFTADWAEDAGRRDFTINALYCSRDGTVFDPLGGARDLEPVAIRFIGDAGRRIEEDYLRILRFFRFTATYSADGVLDRSGLAACVEHRAGLTRISGERIQAEFWRLLVARHRVSVVRALVDSGVFAAMFAVAPQVDRFARLVAIESRLGLPADSVLALTALAVSSGADAAELDERMKLSARDRERMLTAADLAPVAALLADEAAMKAAAYRWGAGRFRDAILIAWARGAGADDDQRFHAAVTLPERWTPPAFLLTGGDIVASGVKPGPQVGAILSEVERNWIEGGFTAGREVLLDLAEKIARGSIDRTTRL